MKEWNKQRSQALATALNQMVYPVLAKELKYKLLQEAKEAVVQVCVVECLYLMNPWFIPLWSIVINLVWMLICCPSAGLWFIHPSIFKIIETAHFSLILDPANFFLIRLPYTTRNFFYSHIDPVESYFESHFTSFQCII